MVITIECKEEVTRIDSKGGCDVLVGARFTNMESAPLEGNILSSAIARLTSIQNVYIPDSTEASEK